VYEKYDLCRSFGYNLDKATQARIHVDHEKKSRFLFKCTTLE
jgi:hypothetical protein